MERPEILYQYFSIESGMEFLRTNKLRLSSLTEFNDPFEFLPKTNYSSELQNKNINKTLELIPNIENLIKETKKYKGNRGLFEILIDGVIGLDYSTNELEKEISIIKHYVKCIETFQISCFSEIRDNILMWGHYSRKHTGIVIAFDTAMDYWRNDLIKVNYNDERIEAPNYAFNSNNNLVAKDKWQIDLLSTKSSCWSYELEWRYIKFKEDCKEDEKGYYKLVPNECIKEIILGCRIDSGNVTEIINIQKNNKENTKLLQAKPDSNTFSIDFENLKTEIV
ncbi:MAG TPA: DUF2971 domain-containing protein [Bacteroidales bacterium]